MKKSKQKTSVLIAVLLALIIIIAIVVILVAGSGADSDKTVGSETAPPIISPSETSPPAANTSAPMLGFEAFFAAARVYPASDTDLGEYLPKQLGEGLVLESAGFFNGVFVESGSLGMAYNILSLLVRNEGERAIKSCEVSIPHAEGEAKFVIMSLPSGESLVVLEKTASDYGGKLDFSGVSVSNVEYFEKDETLDSGDFEVSTEDGKIIVKNISCEDIQKDISVHFKYLAEDRLLGGTDFSIFIPGGLKSGEQKELSVGGYIDSACRITFFTAS